jgi:hypothetical protein
LPLHHVENNYIVSYLLAINNGGKPGINRVIAEKNRGNASENMRPNF